MLFNLFYTKKEYKELEDRVVKQLEHLNNEFSNNKLWNFFIDKVKFNGNNCELNCGCLTIDSEKLSNNCFEATCDIFNENINNKLIRCKMCKEIF